MTRIMSRPARAARSIALALAACSGLAHAADDFVFMTNWYGQAEHGGYYQAQATGLYKEAGLNVTLKMGGPQVNALQLLAAGQADCIMGSSDIQVLRIREQGVPAVTVAAVFQKDPQGIVAHADVKALADLKGRTVLIGTAARNTYWPWLKARYGLDEAQARPYTFNLQPFVADSMTAVQGYVTSDPYIVRKAGLDTRFLLFSDAGWPAYANTIVCMESTLKSKPKVVAAFVKASMTGWKGYLAGDRAAANALIKKDNPEMTDGLLDYAVSTMKERGIATGADASANGIGTLDPARLKQTYDFLVEARLLDPAKVELQKSFEPAFVNEARVMP